MSYQHVVVNPAYQTAYNDWCATCSAYDAAVQNAKEGANNWSEINQASHARNQAKAKLDSIEQYITIETEVPIL